ncbi:hypothetical protein SGFS_065540 [Streptomyces graminofaciens]|uniref:Uncharacterized protein n=1 Tax=Streptomyces graminofaciens TaxID=68212 RepID=A0ABM7FG79_9ACTN|nr:hypothetical protein [Streptomyces graminofaciens]BBC35260.1 hypothetical protein SGFS_065540 [Streptomyces graminofaciens]
MGHATDQAPTPPSPRTEPWPEGVEARYLTVGGATVDITDDRAPHWRCTACTGTSVGEYTGPFGTPFTLDAIHEQAQGHAEKCRALPRPAVAQ